jgi:hypothetical protein
MSTDLDFEPDLPWPNVFGAASSYSNGLPAVAVAPSAQTPVINVLGAILVRIMSKGVIIQGIGVRLVTANASGKIRFGVYRARPDANPAELLFDSGDVSLVSGAGSTIEAPTPGLSLPTGQYWFAWNCIGAGWTIMTCPSSQMIVPGLMHIASTTRRLGLLGAFPYAAMPPSLTPALGGLADGFDVPQLWVRRA